MTKNALLLTAAAIVLVVASPIVSLATPTPPVPEIDANMLVAGIGLLSGGLMVLRARR